MDNIKEFIATKDNTISTMIEGMKRDCGIDENKVESFEVDHIIPTCDAKLDRFTNTVNIIKSVYMNIYVAYMFKSNIVAVYDRVKYCIDEDCKLQPAPVTINRNSGRIDAVNSIQNHGLMDF